MTLFEMLQACLKGTLVAQVAIKRGISIGEVFSEGSTVIKSIADELETLGVDYESLSQHYLNALVNALSNDTAIDGLSGPMAQLLWHSLGNPETGGEKPPKKYIDTTAEMWLCFLSVLNPHFFMAMMEELKTRD